MNWKRFSKVLAWKFFYPTNSNVRNGCVCKRIQNLWIGLVIRMIALIGWDIFFTYRRREN